jgi:ABC-2 type transport system permease protein
MNCPSTSGSSIAKGRGRASSSTWTVARFELLQLRRSPDFFLPMLALAVLFFVVAPALLLWTITHVHGSALVVKLSTSLNLLPGGVAKQVAHHVAHATPFAEAAYALSVYLFAPLAVIVPMTISTAVGANSLVGEREKGTGEFLAHCPAGEREIYTGKLVASLLPGYVTTLVGFGVYAVVVDTIAGGVVGRWFFPTPTWWLLMLWVVPPFLGITLSVVLRLSARMSSAAASQQASGLVTLPVILLSYALSSGGLLGTPLVAFWVGLVAWALAAWSLSRGARSVTWARLLGVDAGGAEPGAPGGGVSPVPVRTP